MKVVIGSTALSYHGINLRPKPSDFDLWITEDEPFQPQSDYHVMSREIMKMVECTRDNGVLYATPNSIATIKMSHLAWDNYAWSKHKWDYLNLKNNHNCEVDEELRLALIEFWKKDLGNKDFLSLDQNTKDFFTDNVEYEFDHDDLHYLVANGYPLYIKCLKEESEVLIDKYKFFAMPKDLQLRMFQEEITVIALERYILNEKNEINSFVHAWNLALRKTITNLTKGWASQFIIENLEFYLKPNLEDMVRVAKHLKPYLVPKFRNELFIPFVLSPNVLLHSQKLNKKSKYEGLEQISKCVSPEECMVKHEFWYDEHLNPHAAYSYNVHATQKTVTIYE